MRARRLLPLAAIALVLLTWSNLVMPVLPGGPVVRAAVNLGGVLVLVAIARAAGLSWHDLGVGRHTWRAGLRWGAAALAVVVVGYAVVYLVAPAVLANPQLAGASEASLLLRGLLLIPLGTVLAEELAFRGVLHGRSRRHLPARMTLGVGAAVFGLWHLTVAFGPSAVPMPSQEHGMSVAAVLVVTAVGGLALGWLRHRTGSVLAPIGLHLGTNSVGLVAAALVLH